MTRAEAIRLLELSREARWTFPSSSGRPVGADDLPLAKRLVGERDAFAEAARFFVGAGEGELALEIAANVWRLWILSRDIAGGRAFLKTVLDAAPTTPRRSRSLALYGDGLLAFWKGALSESRARNEAALNDARAVGDAEATLLAKLGLSRAALSEGDHERALALASESRELARSLEPAMDQAPLHMCAQAQRAAERLAEAAALFSESLELNRRLGDEGMVVVELHNLGHVEVRRGNADAAEQCFDECARRGSADDPCDAAYRELNAAAVACGRGDADRASELLSRAEAMLSKAGMDPAADDQTEIRWIRARLAEADAGRA